MNHSKILRLVLPVLVLFLATGLSGAIPREQEEPRQRALKAIDAAIAALGGDAYRNVKSLHVFGNWFAFRPDGRRSGLVKYWEWLEYEPIKWHFQRATGNRQQVEVYNLELEKGWQKEGKGYVEEMPSERVQSFKDGVKHDIDVLLKQVAHREGISLFYYGPDDIEGGGSLEAVEFLDETNDSVLVYFDRDTHLPKRLEYEVSGKEGFRHEQAQEFYNWHEFDGVQIPLRIDFFTDGDLTEQRHLREVTLNPVIPESQFLEPPIKEKKNKKNKKKKDDSQGYSHPGDQTMFRMSSAS